MFPIPETDPIKMGNNGLTMIVWVQRDVTGEGRASQNIKAETTVQFQLFGYPYYRYFSEINATTSQQTFFNKIHIEPRALTEPLDTGR